MLLTIRKSLIASIMLILILLGGTFSALAVQAIDISPIFQPYVNFPVGSGKAVGIGDFNSDGLADVAITTETELRVFLQNLNGSLATDVVYPAGSRPEAMAVGDVNNDNRADIVVANYTSNTIGVFLQQANGTFAARVTYPTGSGPDALAVGDLNSDGLPDIAVSHWTAPNVGIFTQTAGGSLNPMITYPSPQAGYDDIAIADINHDGKNDLIKMNGQGLNPNLSIYVQAENGTLTSAVAYSVTDCGSFCLSHGIGTGDVTGDGLIDIVISYGGNLPSSKVAVFAQTQDGTLAAPAAYDAYDTPVPIEVADINRDGRADVLVAHSGWNALSVFTQQENGILNNYSLYTLPFGSYRSQGLAVGDLNQDGLADVAVADSNNGLVLVYQTLTPPTPTFTPTNTPIPVMYTISGNVGVGYARLYYSQSGEYITASSKGGYSLTVPAGWSGTITPSLSGYRFTPASRTYSNVQSNQISQNFTAQQIVTISGNAGAFGVTLSYVDGTPRTTTTAADGSYSFEVPKYWSGTVTPSKAGYTFSPTSRTYSSIIANQPGQNYQISPILLTISGNVQLADVTLSYLDYSTGNTNTVLSDSLGNYAILVPYNWNGRVTPSKTGYVFNPVSRDYYSVQTNLQEQNYVPQGAHLISGNVGVGAASVSYFDGINKTVLTDDSGYYSAPVSHHWSGTVTPYKANYAFVPAARSYVDVQGDLSDQNYVAVPLYTISGNVRHAGVSLSYIEAGELKTAVSDSSGNYSFQVQVGWSGTVTPSMAGVVFEPTSRDYVDVQSNQTVQNYQASIPVTSLADSGPGSLRQAIASAGYGDLITFDPDLAGQTITLASTITIQKSVTIDGGGLNPRVEISGGNAVRIFLVDASSTITPTIKNIVLKEGKQTGTSYISYGGAIFVGNDTTFTIENVVIRNNSAYKAGAIYISPYGVVTISNSQITANQSNAEASAVFIHSIGILNLRSSVVSNNVATAGGAIYFTGATNPSIIENNLFADNTALAGGAILGDLGNAHLEIRNNLFTGNRATGTYQAGGAVYFSASSIPTLVILENNTFYNNEAAGVGGGAYLSAAANFYLINNTFSNNKATTGGNLYLSGGASVSKMYNNVIANHAGGGDCYAHYNSYINGGNNLIEDGSAACQPAITGDPLLGPLADNGGPTQTMALLSGSPAIDAGDDANCPATDQRGVPRTYGNHCDIGAYEAENAPRTIYVKWDAGGANSGTSWADAYTDLQSAFASASSGDEIWVGAGTYKPTSGTDRAASFVLKNGVAVYGGFAGSETLRTQSDLLTNVTTLSGDIGAADDNSDNSYHVVIGSNTNNTAVLDGFMITGGNANGSGEDGEGGAIYNVNGNPTWSHLIIRGNSGGIGTGIYNYNSSPTLTNIAFVANSGFEGSRGGAIVNDFNSSPTLTNVIFIVNTDVLIGGAMLNSFDSNPYLENVTFVGNSASIRGGAIYNWESNPTLINVTFSGNSATYGGAISNDSNSHTTIINSILYGDTGGEIDNYSGTSTVSYSIVQGGHAGEGNLDVDPLLDRLQENGGFTPTMALLAGSPAIDAGDNANCPATDQRGIARSQFAPCDIGAYEAEHVSGTLYVKWDASGTNNGSSWTDAYTDLQSALAAASTGDEIWVAAGTYRPTSNADRTISFVLINNVAVYGGFAGTETSLPQRDYQANVTVLSGDIGIAGDNSDNSYHVVIGSNTNNSAVLDGFTITGGNANVSPSDKGGGMYNFHGSPSLTNLIITGNYATFGGGMNNESLTLMESSNPNLSNVSFINNTAVEGGGMRNMNYSSPTLENVKFQNNTVLRAGGGMVNMYQNNVNMLNVEFSGNAAGTGGGLANAGSNPTLENVTFSNNSAEWGGAISNGYSSPTITNATFYGNSATTYGGAISNESNSNPTLTNVTISGNSAVTYGGGIYNDYNGGSIRNSIIYGNTGGAIYNSWGNASVSYSIVEGGYPGTGNLDIAPLLLPLQDNGGFTETMAIISGSPAIDAGNDSLCPSTDQRGSSRPQGSHCDIGAYEAQHYTISGNAGAPGVILSYADTIFGVACVALPDGSLSCTPPQPVPASKYHYVTADQDGNYSFQMPQGWIGTVVPSKPGYIFSPAKRTYFDLANEQLAQDYTASVVDSVLPPDPGSTRRVVPADAVPTDDALNFELLDISGNGRYVAYVSNSPDLVPGDSNERSDVFVWDRLTNTTQRVSVNSGGEQANDHSFYPSLSKDGRYVAFESWATNLDTACISGRNIYVHDMQTGNTICVSVNASGEMGNSTSDRPMISADGRYVVYKSFAYNLVSGDTNNQWDVFVFDIFSRTTVRASVASTGVQGNSYSENAAISGDGRYVAFWSNASTLVNSDTNGTRDIFVRDLLNNTTSRVSVSSSGVEANGLSFQPSISEDGRFVAFASFATNLVDGDTNAKTDVFVHDRQTMTTSRVSVSSNNAQGNDISTFPTISGNGRFVVFESNASNLVSNDTSVWNDIFVRDLLTNKTSRVSVASDGTQANNDSTLASLSSDGRYVVFESSATNLVSPVVPNRYEDAYLHERDTVPPAIVSVTRADANPTFAAQVNFHVTFSEAVTGVDVSDFSLTTSGPTGAAVNAVSGSGTLYTVSVTTGSGAGTIRLDVVDDDSIMDAASNPLGGVGPGNGDFNLGESYTIPQILTLNATSVAANDGWILESSETSNLGGSLNAIANTIDVGDDKGNKQYVGVLHFDTSSLPDNAVITSVTLRVQRQGIIGTDPFTTHGNLVLDVQRPYFGTTAGLLATDFQAVPGQAAISTFDPSPVNNWYSATIDNAGYVYINLGGTTQFRLRFSMDDDDDRRADFIKFYSGEATATNRPQLIIQYYIP